jgi:transposase
MGKGRKFNADFKARVAMEAIKSRKTTAELSSEFEVHASQIAKWKKQAVIGLKNIFLNTQEKAQESQEKRLEILYGQIGKLQVENDFLKKTVYRS